MIEPSSDAEITGMCNIGYRDVDSSELARPGINTVLKTWMLPMLCHCVPSVCTQALNVGSAPCNISVYSTCLLVSYK